MIAQKELLSKKINSSSLLPKPQLSYMSRQEYNYNIVNNLFNTLNDSIINNTNNDIIEDDEDIDEINEENIYENSFGDHVLPHPINDSHRLFTNKNKFSKIINSIPLKRIMIPKPKYPKTKGNTNTKNKNNSNDNSKKLVIEKKNILSQYKDFVHCRNCMLILAFGKHGKLYINK